MQSSLKNEFTEDKKCHNLMRWLKLWILWIWNVNLSIWSDWLPMLLWNNQMDVTRCQIFKSPSLMSDLQRWGRGGRSNQRPLACRANALSHRDKLPYCEFLHKELNLKDSVSFCIFPEISWTCQVFSPGRKSQPDDKVQNWPGHQIISQQDQKVPSYPLDKHSEVNKTIIK